MPIATVLVLSLCPLHGDFRWEGWGFDFTEVPLRNGSFSSDFFLILKVLSLGSVRFL